jgi:hypothetical protein
MKNKNLKHNPTGRTQPVKDERIAAIKILHPRKHVTLPVNVKLPGADWERLAQCSVLAKVNIDTIVSKLLAFEYFGDSCEMLSRLSDGEKLT